MVVTAVELRIFIIIFFLQNTIINNLGYFLKIICLDYKRHLNILHQV